MRGRFWVFPVEDDRTRWLVLRESMEDAQALVAVGGAFATRKAALAYIERVREFQARQRARR